MKWDVIAYGLQRMQTNAKSHFISMNAGKKPIRNIISSFEKFCSMDSDMSTEICVNECMHRLDTVTYITIRYNTSHVCIIYIRIEAIKNILNNITAEAVVLLVYLNVFSNFPSIEYNFIVRHSNINSFALRASTCIRSTKCLRQI